MSSPADAVSLGSSSGAGVGSVTVPTRSRARRLAAPIACGCAAVGLAGVFLVADPSERTILPPCPLYATTGVWCPGCGLTRATHAFVNGDVVAALGYNLFAPLILSALLVSWWSWVRVSTDRPPVRWERIPTAVWVVLGVAAVAFTIARNTATFGYLAP